MWMWMGWECGGGSKYMKHVVLQFLQDQYESNNKPVCSGAFLAFSSLIVSLLKHKVNYFGGD